jgi:hypothetical protein
MGQAGSDDPMFHWWRFLPGNRVVLATLDNLTS